MNGLRVERHDSIREIEEGLWDSIVAEGDFFHTHRFIRSVEEAEVERSRSWCLLFFAGPKLVGSAALSAFSISLDLFTGRLSRAAVRLVRKVFPGFLKVRILFCGLPISIGKHNLAIPDPAREKAVLDELDAEMVRLARSLNIRFLCVKEFGEERLGPMAPLVGAGFLCLPSLPFFSLPIRWASFAEYLQALRHGYRRQIKASLAKAGWAEPPVLRRPGGPGPTMGPTISLRTGDAGPPEAFYELYMEVMRHARVKLETLNEEFFRRLFGLMGDRLDVLTFALGDEALASALLVQSGPVMTFLLVGLRYDRFKSVDAYFNLISAIVKLSIERGCARLDLGQTSPYIKQRIGGQATRTFFYLRSTRPAVHSLLRASRRIMFPEVPVERLRVFKDAAGVGIKPTSRT